MGLRLAEGVDPARLEARCGKLFADAVDPGMLARLRGGGIPGWRGGGLAATDGGPAAARRAAAGAAALTSGPIQRVPPISRHAHFSGNQRRRSAASCRSLVARWRPLSERPNQWARTLFSV